VKKYVFRLFLDFEKEEAWYNEMARSGWMLDGYFLIFYRFTKGEPEEYIYREELLPDLAGGPKSQAYLDFLKSADVEVVATWGKWIIYRRKASDGAFEVYTDTDSRIAHYHRVSRLFLLCFAVELMVFFLVILFLFIDPSWLLLVPFLATFLIGLALFLIGWRFRKKHRQLVKDQQLLEWEQREGDAGP